MKSKYLNCVTIDIWTGQFVVGNGPVHWKMFSSIPGIFSLDTSSTHPHLTTKNVSRHFKLSPGQICLRTTGFS